MIENTTTNSPFWFGKVEMFVDDRTGDWDVALVASPGTPACTWTLHFASEEERDQMPESIGDLQNVLKEILEKTFQTRSARSSLSEIRYLANKALEKS